MPNSLREFLTTPDNKEKFLMFLESRGLDLNFKKEEIHSLIHGDLEFFLNLIRLYCYKNSQVGTHLNIEELINKLGHSICKSTSNSLKIYTEGLDEDEDNTQDLTSISYLLKEDPNISDFLQPRKKPIEFSKKEEKKSNRKIKVSNIDAEYKIISTLNGVEKEKSCLYRLGAYSEQKLLKDYPTYFPSGSLDYHDLGIARINSKLNVLLESDNPTDNTLYFKIKETSHINDTYEAAVLQRNIEARDVSKEAIDADIDHVFKTHKYYSEFGGLSYPEQLADQLEIYNKLLPNISDPSERAYTKKIIERMEIMYKFLESESKKKEE